MMIVLLLITAADGCQGRIIHRVEGLLPLAHSSIGSSELVKLCQRKIFHLMYICQKDYFSLS